VAGADLHRQRLWQLGELAATLSHDLGQPLNVIRLTAEASQDAAAHGRLDDARLNRTLDNMVTQAMRAQGMIDALVQVTRRPSQPPAHLRPVEVVRGVLAELLPQLKAHGIALRWHADPATPTVLGHAPRLAAAVRHLVVNAVEALAGLPIERKGGTISVDCRAEGRSVVIVVADDGPGFPAALAPLLDNPLAPPSERGKGCGLGLALTLGIAAEMGGSLRLDDSVYGARLVLSLPQARRSVLVAEDDEAAAQELANYLEAKGWQVGLAHGGNPALALFERQAPDAVVTDLHMADGDGWTLIARLHGIAPDLPIIAISTADGEDARRAVTAGAALVLRKPVGLQDLYGDLKSLLDGP
jgi:CheY-like chemotaxis protein